MISDAAGAKNSALERIRSGRLAFEDTAGQKSFHQPFDDCRRVRKMFDNMVQCDETAHGERGEKIRDRSFYKCHRSATQYNPLRAISDFVSPELPPGQPLGCLHQKRPVAAAVIENCSFSGQQLRQPPDPHPIANPSEQACVSHTVIVERIEAGQLCESRHRFLKEGATCAAFLVPRDVTQPVFMIRNSNAVRNLRRATPVTNAPSTVIRPPINRGLHIDAHPLCQLQFSTKQTVVEVQLIDKLPRFAPTRKHSNPPAIPASAPRAALDDSETPNSFPALGRNLRRTAALRTRDRSGSTRSDSGHCDAPTR